MSNIVTSGKNIDISLSNSSGINVSLNQTQKNSAIFLVIGGQSNSGTDPATGRVAYSLMPDNLTTARNNIYAYDLQLGTTLDFALYVPQSDRQMGWIDQLLYQLSFIYRKVYFVKRSVGGTSLAATAEAYPRADLIARANNAFAKIDLLESNYDLVGLWCQGESDGTSEVNADAYEQNLSDWFDEWRTSIQDMPIIFNKLSNEQAEDVPFYATIQNAQDSVASLSSDNITFETDDLRTSQNRDYSHFSVASCIEIGNRYLDQVFTLFSRTKKETINPVVISAIVDEATPNIINITLSKTLAADVVPFASDFILTNRSVKDYSISGNVISLELGERYYSGDVITITYDKNSNYDDTSLQDLYGNKLAAFSSLSVTNNTTLVEPTFTSVYESDFSISVDGFLTLNGATLDFGASIGGVNDCLKYITDGNDIIYRSGTIASGETYRILFDVYITTPLVNTAPDQYDDGISSILRNGNNIVETLQEKIKYNSWYSFRNLTLSTGDSEFRFQIAGTLLGGSIMYIKNLKIFRQD